MLAHKAAVVPPTAVAGLPAAIPPGISAGPAAKTTMEVSGPDNASLSAAPGANRLIVEPRPLPSRDFLYGVILAGGILLMIASTLWRGRGGII